MFTLLITLTNLIFYILFFSALKTYWTVTPWIGPLKQSPSKLSSAFIFNYTTAYFKWLQHINCHSNLPTLQYQGKQPCLVHILCHTYRFIIQRDENRPSQSLTGPQGNFHSTTSPSANLKIPSRLNEKKFRAARWNPTLWHWYIHTGRCEKVGAEHRNRCKYSDATSRASSASSTDSSVITPHSSQYK